MKLMYKAFIRFSVNLLAVVLVYRLFGLVAWLIVYFTEVGLYILTHFIFKHTANKYNIEYTPEHYI